MSEERKEVPPEWLDNWMTSILETSYLFDGQNDAIEKLIESLEGFHPADIAKLQDADPPMAARLLRCIRVMERHTELLTKLRSELIRRQIIPH